MKKVVFLIGLCIVSTLVYGQGFLHTKGKYIYNGNEQEVILRGIGTGNWMIQEGYMMQSSDVAHTQRLFRQKLVAATSEEATDSFYTVWLHSHFRKIDVDSMKAWGFNSIRVAMHYVWFTLPVDEEPVPGEQTWLDTGFSLLDSLLDWCTENEMYLILDLHGAPGGQGKDEAISDYNPAKPSLWEDPQNKIKTIALWRKLAERYSEEAWIGGYDLLNETNWTFPEGNNSQLRKLFGDITTAIREVDTNHILFIEGNSFANDFSGLTPKWDQNMAYSFHKYWTYNDAGSLDWVLNLRTSQNCPLWLGESGENSNSWFTSLVSLCEKNHIGWSWWPVKKPGINNPLQVTVNTDYANLIKYWAGTGAAMGAEQALNAVLKFAENHKLENCAFRKDVVDALIRQPKTAATKPFSIFTTGDAIFASDYNLGREGIAYHDQDTADYHGSGIPYAAWNQGWSYRNDGVDIEVCTDNDECNGYNVGFTNAGEWMEYTVDSDTSAAFSLIVRSASGGTGSKFHLEENGVPLTKKLSLPGTGGWQSWKSSELDTVILTRGRHTLRFYFDQGGSNLNYFRLAGPYPADSIVFTHLMAQCSADGKTVYLSLNKPVTGGFEELQKADFTVKAGTVLFEPDSIAADPLNPLRLIISLKDPIYYGAKPLLAYQGTALKSGNQQLAAFSGLEVANKLPVRYNIPGKIQAENFAVNKGFSWETCTDAGGGLNSSYAAAGDYLDYNVYVPANRSYLIAYRVATIRTNAEIVALIDAGGSFVAVDTFKFTPTGGWQSWTSQSSKLSLPAGRYTLRLLARNNEFNLNWFQLSNDVGIQQTAAKGSIKIYPNPAKEEAWIESPVFESAKTQVLLMDMLGRIVYNAEEDGPAPVKIGTTSLPSGLYLLLLKQNGVMLQSSRLRIE